MNLLRNFTIRRVMLIVLILFCLLCSAVGSYSLWTLSRIAQSQRDEGPLVAQIELISQGSERYLNLLSQSGDARQNLDALRDGLAAFRQIPSAPAQAESAADAVARWQALLDDGASGAGSKSGPAFLASTARFIAQANRQLAQTRSAVDDISSAARIPVAAAIVLGLLLLLFSDRYLVMMLVRPLQRVREHFRLIAQGDLSQPVEEIGRNCVGQMVPILNAMQESLRDAVGAIRGSSDSIWQGASEIASGNGSLSRRTEEQAAALEQTAASMAQITAAVEHNAQSAHRASGLAQEAAGTADSGAGQVEALVAKMSGISRSSARIAEITDVINSIAFQTNILALNAAVEAARAGEQGRGFAVVASEVRNLAGRSAQAAKEIEGLIADAAAQVAEGVSLAGNAGSSMEEIVQSVERVTGIMQQIASASEEQSRGIAQVGIAIAQMDGVTQQNASLVEQVSTASAALEAQTDVLQGAVRRFRLAAEPA
ncbi:methyl-accepting chemotaxis protein [uncultured Pluralibacter sp.]|uniref:methyl-accepting chemotaxis protein n=1 Tax=uncultured Pluralibacter sp. TaxID=1490864 RepID=UPI0026057AD4|nr:methyl-accepting chemotaxis protein [uncultured Pluralibacter sp.]